MVACELAIETATAPRSALRQRILRAGLVALFAVASAMLFVVAPAHAQVITATLSDANDSHGVAINPVTNKIYLADSEGTLTVIDGATNAISSPSNTYGGLGNWAVAVNSVTNMVYVVDRSASKIYAFTGATATSPATYAATISPGAGNLFSIAINPATNMIYVCDDGNAYVVVIDGNTNTEVTTVSLGSTAGVPNFPLSVAVNPVTNMIYVAENDSNAGCTSGCIPNQIGVISGSSNSVVANIGVGNSPVAVVINPVTNLIYVANSGSNSVSVIDGSSNTVTATVTSPEMMGPAGLAVNPETNQVFVANSGSDYASVISGTTTPATDVNTSSGTSGFVSIAVDTSTDQAYLANGSQGTVAVINGSNLSATPDVLTAQASANLEQIAVNPVTHKAYAITNGSGTSAISVIDGATYQVATPAYPQSQPWAVAVNPVTNTIFVADNGSSTVSVIDGSTNTLDPASPITVGANPNALVVDPINNLVYVSNFNGSSVSVINGASLSSTPSTITLQNGSNDNLSFTPNLLAFNPVLNQVYGASTGQGVGYSFAGGQNSQTVSAGSFSGGSTPIAIGTNPAQGYNYAVFSDTSALQISDSHGGGAFPVCSSPTSADVNTVTNTIYVACGGSSGTLDAIQGADSFTPGTPTTISLTNSSSAPTAVVVNSVTNTIYVTDEPIESIAYLYVVGASNNNSVTTINLGNNGCYSPASLAVNVASNKIYVLCAGDDNEPGPQVVVFDGATNTLIRTLPVGGSVNNLQNEIAADPVTGNIYSLAYQGGNPGAVSVYTENPVQSNTLTTTITPLTNNTTNVISPSFTFNTTPATGIYFQVDSQQGAWIPATIVPDENSQYFTGTASDLTPGFHILYAYATDSRHGIAANSGPVSDEDSPFVGTIASYGFLVAPPIATINAYPLNFGTVPPGGVSSSPNPILINNGGAPMTYSYTINGASEFVVDQDQSTCSTSGTLAPNTYCEIYVTFNPNPSDSGTLTATLTWTDDSLGVSGSMQSIGFTGTAGTSGVTPPVFGEGAANPSYIQNSLFSFSDSDGSVTSYLCSFTTGMTISPNYLPCSQSVSESNLSENMYYTFAVEAVDNQGNVSAPISQTWEVIPSSVSVTFAGSGTGQVTSTSPTGLSCTSSCSAPFDGVPVTIMAAPAAGSTFAGWSNEYNVPGNTCTGTANPCVLQTGDSFQVVTATFNSLVASSYTLTVTEYGTGTGAVTDGTTALDCTETGGTVYPPCSNTYSTPTVTLTEIPQPGTSFIAWGGACATTPATSTTCTVPMTSNMNVTADFVPTPTPVPLTFVTSSGPESMQATYNCPGNPNPTPSNPCTAPFAYAVNLGVQSVSSQFTVNVVATEVPPSLADGICESNTDTTPASVQNDFDCRFLNFFNYGTDTLTGGAIVPRCVPIANGNCVHYLVYGSTPGEEPPTTSYVGPVNWTTTWNDDAATATSPGPYWLLSTPQLYDDPDSAPTPSSAVGTSCSSVMLINGNVNDPTTYYCQFEFNITTFYNAAEPVDSGIGGSTKQFNDVVVAWPPTSTPVNPTLPLLNGLSTTTPANGTASYGTGIGFTVTLTNNGATTASGITLYDPLPAGATWTLGSSSISGCTISGSSPQVLSCSSLPSGFSLAPSAKAIFTVTGSNAAAGVYSNVTTFTIGTQQTLTVATVTVQALTSAFSNLASYNITYGQSTLTISGTISAGSSHPPAGESVMVTIGSTTEPATITGTSGAFSVAFPTATIPASSTPYPITYSYTSDGNFSSVTNNTSSTLTVSKATSTTTITSNSPNPSTVGAPVSVGVKATGSGISPSGSVIVTAKLSSTTVTCTATLSSGAGGCSVTLSTAGSWTLTASYAGDTNYSGSSTSAGTPQTVNAAGSTLKFSPSSLNFGTVYVGSTALQATTITNTGSSMVTFTNFSVMAISGDDSTGFLGIELCPKTLNAGKSCTIIMSFTADSNVTKTHAANLLIADNAAGSPQTVPMTATVINPQATLSPSSLNFGNQKTGTKSAAKTVTLTNSGTTSLNLSGLSITGNFAIVPGGCTSSTTLTPGNHCAISVTFTPTSRGSKSGSLKITDNAKNSPQSISLSGNGT